MDKRPTVSVRRKQDSITTWSSPPTSASCRESWQVSQKKRRDAPGAGMPRCGVRHDPSRGLVQGTKPMPTTEKNLRVLIVDDNRDGADALGLLVEELGHQVHVTYGGTNAL